MTGRYKHKPLGQVLGRGVYQEQQRYHSSTTAYGKQHCEFNDPTSHQRTRRPGSNHWCSITRCSVLEVLTDPSHEEVFTKPDCVSDLECTLNNSQWIDIREGKSYRCGHGYSISRQPTYKERNDGITHSEAREKEARFFDDEKLWLNKFGRERYAHFGTTGLCRDLVDWSGHYYQKPYVSIQPVSKSDGCLPTDSDTG